MIQDPGIAGLKAIVGLHAGQQLHAGEQKNSRINPTLYENSYTYQDQQLCFRWQYLPEDMALL
jgi:hypothetical protein